MGFIAIAAKHRESVVPTNPDYASMFEMLRIFDRRTQPIDDSIDDTDLQGCDAILVGEPHDEVEIREIETIMKWVETGGSLLLMGAMGGDAAPTGRRENKSNLSDFVEGLSFRDDSLGVDKGVLAGRPFDTKLPVPITKLTGRRGELCYDTGCSLLWRGDRNSVTHRLDAPPGTSAVHGVRLSGSRVSARDPYPADAEGETLLARLRFGRGVVVALGSSWIFKEDTLIRLQNIDFLVWLIGLWIPELASHEINQRKQKPQRHRLLHGYPMPSMMLRATGNEHDAEMLEAGIAPDPDRPLLIGVLPHSFCRPAVKGCGFCTFPHEVYSEEKARSVMAHVVDEIHGFLKRRPEFAQRRVPAVYFGGGTANLVPDDAFVSLCQRLSGAFDLAGAEVTLEGVPSEFLRDGGVILRLLRENLSVCRCRISMGIQTFDTGRLTQMGRRTFGDEDTFRAVAALARDLGMTTSADLLFNLPGQGLNEMRVDVEKAIALELDHVCLYHLVLFRLLGTEWSRDPELLARLPSNDEAMENWMTLREILLARGYRQTTLTNFEHERTADTPDRFLYEEGVLRPEANDWLGFGPSAISLVLDAAFDRGLKWVNPETAEEYVDAVEGPVRVAERHFAYSHFDVKVLFITRGIARLSVDRRIYARLLDADPLEDFESEFRTLEDAGLVTISDVSIDVTPAGMFYADTIAGLIAQSQVRYYRCRAIVEGLRPQAERTFYGNEAAPNRMG